MYKIYKIKNFFNSILLISFFVIYSNCINARNLELIIKGNKNLDKEFIESIVDINIEAEDDELINYIIKELFSSGYFESVTAKVVNLIENPVINNIKFINNDRFNDSELSNFINETPIDITVYNKSNVEEIKRILIQYYKVYGYNLVNISYSVKNIDNGQIDLYYDVNEGEITKIQKINIIGNEYFSKRKVRSILKSTESKFYKLVSSTS